MPVTRWSIEAHQFRIDTVDGLGRPTPEGAHRDGVDFVAVVLVARNGVKGGETRVFEANGPDGQRFTLTELQQVYEALLGSALDKRSFRRRIEELDIVEEVTGVLSEGGAHRPAQLYRRKRKMQFAVADSNLGVKP